MNYNISLDKMKLCPVCKEILVIGYANGDSDVVFINCNICRGYALVYKSSNKSILTEQFIYATDDYTYYFRNHKSMLKSITSIEVHKPNYKIQQVDEVLSIKIPFLFLYNLDIEKMITKIDKLIVIS